MEHKNAVLFTKANFAHLVAGCEVGDPTMRGQLTWTRQGVGRLGNVGSINQHIPMLAQFTLLIALLLAFLGYPRAGCGLIIQQSRCLRPSELLRLKSQDVILPGAFAFGDETTAAINLGMRTGTKSKRARAVLVGTTRRPRAFFCLCLLKSTTRLGQELLSGLRLQEYDRLIVVACERLNIAAYTSHSPRAEFATEASCQVWSLLRHERKAGGRTTTAFGCPWTQLLFRPQQRLRMHSLGHRSLT